MGTTTTRVLMLTEYLDKENEKENVIQEHVNKWEDDKLIQKEWKDKAQKLNKMFKGVDDFALENDKSPNISREKPKTEPSKESTSTRPQKKRKKT